MIAVLGWSLLHFVWQGAAAVLLLLLLNRLLQHAAPQLRYLMASATLALMLLLPVLTFVLLQSAGESSRGGLPGAGPEVARTAGAFAGPLAAVVHAAEASPDVLDGLRRRIEPLLPGFVGLWGAGVLLLSLRSLGGWALVQRLRRSGLVPPDGALERSRARLCQALRIAVPVRLWQSALVQVPTVIGALRPIVLLPPSALTGLSPEQVELILAHELAHIRRWDYLVNLLQSVVETMLFYHPAVWWVSHRMRVEREHCCDDLAVAACGNPLGYARALADLQGLCWDPPAFAMAATGGSLFERVARLVAPPRHLSRASRGLAILIAAGSLALALGLGPALVGRPMPTLAAPGLVALAGTDETPREAAGLDPGEEPTPKAAPRPAAHPQPAPASEARAFPLERILELARAGVTPEYIDEMDRLGYPSLTVEQLIGLRSQGVGPEYIQELAEAGHVKLTPEDLVSLRSHGISGSYARELGQQGLTGLSLSDLVELRDQGVSPEFIAELKKAGYTGLSASKLVEVRSHGVSGPYLAEMGAAGYDGVPLDKLVEARDAGVTPEYVRGLADLGYRGLDLSQLVELRNHGVTPDYVRGLKAAGYAGLPAETLVELRDHGVTPDFVTELKDAGYLSLKPSELIELKDNGVGGELLKRLRSRR
jgi:beta-lactamase regulating signal transducer with metallopeptidase domain